MASLIAEYPLSSGTSFQPAALPETVAVAGSVQPIEKMTVAACTSLSVMAVGF